MTLPFGKFRGRSLAEVPSNYLLWVLETVITAEVTLLTAIHDELAERLGLEPVPMPVLQT